MSKKKITLTMDDVLTLIGLAALSEMDPDRTSPEVMAVIYRARSVVDTSAKGHVKIDQLMVEVIK